MKTVFSRWQRAACLAAATIVSLFSLPAQAAGAFDNPLSEASVQATRNAVRSMIGNANALPSVPAASGQPLPELAIGTGDNVAGVLEYCVNSNVLNRASVDPVKATLLSHVGLSTRTAAESAYQNGAAGVLVGVDGRTLDLRTAQPQLKEQACDYVLASTKSLI